MIQSIRWDGKPISVPGIYSDLPLPDYHRGDICDGPSTSSSGLRKIWEPGPAHYWDTSPLNPNRNEDEDDKEAFIIGRALHHLILGQEYFANEFVIRPDKIDGEAWQGNKKICKAWLASMKREGKTVLTEPQIENITGMGVALGRNPMMLNGIMNGLVERSIFWRDEETGIWLKARPDSIPTDDGQFADLKTTPSILYRKLKTAIDERCYQMQAALVIEGARAIGLDATGFTNLWIEKKRPYSTRVTTMQNEDLKRGHDMNRVCLRTFADCYERWTAAETPEDKLAAWPGPGDERPDAEYIELSDAARKRIDDRLKFQLREAA